MLSRSAIEDAAADLTWRAPGAGRELDVARSLAATVERGGLPTLVHRRQTAAPRYLVLEDIAAGTDRWQVIYDELLAGLAREGVTIERYRFVASPEHCLRPDGQAVPLGELIDHADALIVIGDGDAAIDPIDGRPAGWLALLHHIPRRLWINPVPPVRWSAGAHAIAEDTPMEHGVARAVAALHASVDRRARPERPYPAVIERAPETASAVAALRAALGEPAFHLVSAVAVTGPPTLAAARWLAEVLALELDEQDWLAVATSPWFRTEAWPEGLRDRLQEALEADASELASAVAAVTAERHIASEPARGSVAHLAWQLDGVERAARRGERAAADRSLRRIAATPLADAERKLRAKLGLPDRLRRTRRWAFAFGVSLVILAVMTPHYWASHLATLRQERKAALQARNLGRFVLSLEPFDWDYEAQRAIPTDPGSLGLEWQLQAWTDDGPGAPYVEGEDVERTAPRLSGAALAQDVEARGGRAYLAIRRRGCTPSLLPVKDLPGYAQRERPVPTFHVRVPTCAATAAGMLEIAAGPFRYGGAGTPPSRVAARLGLEQRINLPRFWIDRTEVTNAAFAMLADMAAITGIEAPSYPDTPSMKHGGDPRKPVTGVNWYTARDYCRYLGKDLPTSEQWVKAMRGGEKMPDGSDNPIPDRNYPFGIGDPYQLAALTGSLRTSEVATHPGDASPYGVLDMTGNAEEWTLTAASGRGTRVLRGGGALEPVGDRLLDVMAIPNTRVASQPLFAIGERCVVNDVPVAPPPASQR